MSVLDRWREFRRAQRDALRASNHPHERAESSARSGPTACSRDILPGAPAARRRGSRRRGGAACRRRCTAGDRELRDAGRPDAPTRPDEGAG